MGVNKWIFNKIRHIDKKRMNRHIDRICKENNVSRIYVKFDIFRNFLKYGCGYTDYFMGDYINLTDEEKKTFMTAKSFYQLVNYLNNPKYRVVLGDKIIFNKCFREFIKRDFIDLHVANEYTFAKFLEDKEIVFAKNPNGDGGEGITKIDIKTCGDLDALYKKLKKKRQYLIEEAIVQSKEVNEINPNMVNSFRVVTLYKDEKVYIVGNALRVEPDKADVTGRTSSLFCSLDEDGKINSNVIDTMGNIYEKHPLTGIDFKNVTIPGVKKAFELCKKASMTIPEERYIGWDVAFTDKGPLIIEGNEYPGYFLVQHYKLNNSHIGHLKKISDILGEEMTKIKN